MEQKSIPTWKATCEPMLAKKLTAVFSWKGCFGYPAAKPNKIYFI